AAPPRVQGAYVVPRREKTRVVFYPAGSTTATEVYGQGCAAFPCAASTFTTATSNYPSGHVNSQGISQPNAVAVDGSGGVYIADCFNNRILYSPPGTAAPS